MIVVSIHAHGVSCVVLTNTFFFFLSLRSIFYFVDYRDVGVFVHVIYLIAYAGLKAACIVVPSEVSSTGYIVFVCVFCRRFSCFCREAFRVVESCGLNLARIMPAPHVLSLMMLLRIYL